MELGGPQVGVACEQALWRRGWKRKESLQLRLWNLNICIEKSRCEMLIVASSPSFSSPAARAAPESFLPG